MRLFIGTLYGRLALVLIVSLGAGFGTMYSVFRSHSDDNRLANLARTISVQVHLVEEVLRAHPDFDKNPSSGIVLLESPSDRRASSTDQAEFLSHLKTALKEELGRTSALRQGSANSGGFWIQLADVPQGERWLYFPAPRRRSHVEPWTWGLWASFFVVLVGGMALLWGVNKPLRRLENAIDQVGRGDTPIVDISGPREIRNLAEQFNQMVLRLKQYDQDRAEMLAGVAHDLRAPITRLRLQLELEESARRDAMIGNLDGIDAIVNQFLSFAKGIDLERHERRCIRSFIEEAAGPYLSKGVTVNLTEQPEIELNVMPTLLHRALVNLLENAIEYGALPISIDCERLADGVVIRVSDHGPGIPAEKIDLAVQAFTRLDTARSGKGHCGLGLAIVARIARLHQGHLTLGQAEPNGLIAEILLPMTTPPAQSQQDEPHDK